MKLVIRSAAEDDIVRQVEWYAAQGLFDIARRFRSAVEDAVIAMAGMPDAGTPHRLDESRLAGLRSWSVTGLAHSESIISSMLTP